MSQKKQKPTADELSLSLYKMLVPEAILTDFDIYSVIEQKDRWILEFREKEERIPLELSSYSQVHLDGYCNPLEIQSHVFVTKPVYFQCYRRRWKSPEDLNQKHYSNEYKLTVPHTKITPELGDFLKGTNRRTPYQY